MRESIEKLHTEFARLRETVVCQPSGFFAYPYLVPGGYYKQMWDWDGFFIGVHLSTRNPEDAKYLKWWALTFIDAADESGFVPGCITTSGPRKDLGHFPMKPFLAQGILIASRTLGDFLWIEPHYDKVKQMVTRREKTHFDPSYGLFYWDDAMQSGADNNPALSNDPAEAGTILACDMNTFQLREYISLAKIAAALGKDAEAAEFESKADVLAANIRKYHWFVDDETFFNVYRSTGEPVRCVSYSNFIPLLQSLAPMEEGRRMIERYLWNEDHMRSKYGLRSLSKSDPKYNNVNMIVPYSNWEGPIWPIANYLYFQGLMNYGCKAEAEQLATMMRQLCLGDIAEYGSMHENYNADTGESLAPTADQFSTGVFEGFVGWNLLIENMQEDVETGANPLEI